MTYGVVSSWMYLIGSVFAPMIAVQIADYFLLKTDVSHREWSASRLAIWFVGFLLYRWLMGIDLPLGCALPDMAITVVLVLAWGSLFEKSQAKSIGQRKSPQKDRIGKLGLFL